MVVGSWVLERTPRDKCHLTTSHQRITPSTRPHAAEADCGSGWQMLVRSPCCQFLCFFFLSQCIYFWIHQIITVYILSILYFYLLTVPQESQTKVNITDLSFFFCPVFHTALWSPVTLNSTGCPESREPTWITWNCSAQRVYLFSPSIHLSFTQAL